MPYVPSFSMCFLPYVPSCPTRLMPSCPRASCLKYLVPYVPHMPYALRISCHTCLYLVYSRAARTSNLTYFRCFKPDLPWCISCLVVFMPCASCAFGALAIWVFLQFGLSLIFVIDSSEDALNQYIIDTLYPLRISTYVKNEFQNLQTRFKSNRRGLGYV